MDMARPLLRFARWMATATATALLVALNVNGGFGQARVSSFPQLKTGDQIYHAACVSCHGEDGRGMPTLISAFRKPSSFPDFTRCDQTTAELDSAYKGVITHGGPYQGFSQIMPAFGEALTSGQVDEVVHYLRHFCRNPHWPRAELNLPLAFVTEKAYPEDEEVIMSAVNARGTPGVTSQVIHEQRFGVKNQIEVDVPFDFQDENHTWYGGVGDATLGIKRVMFSSLHTGSIMSLFGGVIVPSGNKFRGFGSGATTFETFAAYDQLFKTQTFFETQFGADLPRHTNLAPQSLFFNTAIGQNIAADHGLGRLWSPMVEFVSTRDLANGAKMDWDVIPQMEVSISPRQHIRGALGVRFPATNTVGRPVQLMMYLLWDWQDGGLTKGW